MHTISSMPPQCATRQAIQPGDSGANHPARVIIAIPTYNRSSRLKSAIASAQCQSFPNLIIWVFDNASTDDTESVVAKLQAEDPRIEYTRNTTNLGFSGNVQRALRALKASDPQYFTFLCDDDILFSDHLRELTTQLDAHPESAWWRGRQASYINKTAFEWREESFDRAGLYTNAETIRAMSQCDMLPFWSSVLFRTAAFRDFDLPDNFYTYEYFLIYPIAHGWSSGSSKTLVHMDIEHSGSITYNPNFDDSWAWQGMSDYAVWLAELPIQGDALCWRQLLAKRIDARIGSFFYRHGGKQALLGNTMKALRIAGNLSRRGYRWKAHKIRIAAVLLSLIGGPWLFKLASFLFTHIASKLSKIQPGEYTLVESHVEKLVLQ